MKVILIVASIFVMTSASAEPKYDLSSPPRAVKASLKGTAASGCYLIDTRSGFCTITYVPGSINGGDTGSAQ